MARIPFENWNKFLEYFIGAGSVVRESFTFATLTDEMPFGNEFNDERKTEASFHSRSRSSLFEIPIIPK